METLSYISIIVISVFSIIILATIIGKRFTNRTLTASVITMNLGISLWQIVLLYGFNINNSVLIPKLAFSIVPWALLGMIGLAFLFPDNKASMKTKITLISIATINTIFGLITLLTDLVISNYREKDGQVTFGSLGNTLLTYLGATVLVLIGIFIFRYYKERRYRLHLRYIFLIFISYLSLSFVINLILPYIGYEDLVVIGALLGLIVEAGIEYILLANRLYKTNYLLGKVLQRVIWALTLYALFYLAVFINYRLWGTVFSKEAYIFGLVLATIIALITYHIFNSINKTFEEKILYGKFPPSKALDLFARRTSETLSIKDITKEISRTITDVVGVEKFGILLYQNKNRTIFHKSFSEDFDSINNQKLNNIITAVETVTKKDEPLVAATKDLIQKESKRKHLANKLADLGIHTFVHMNIGANSSCLMLLGNRASQEPITVQDYNFLHSFVHPASVSLARAILYKEVQQFNVTLQKKVDEATEELKDRNEELQKLYMNLEHLYAKEKDLMDIAGHELRTPASIIKTNLSLLKNYAQKTCPEEFDNERIQNYMRRLTQATERQIKLVNTFLESARIDNQKFELQFDTADITQMIKDAVEDSRHFATEKALQLRYTPPKKKIHADVDASRLREVIDNILNNAIKYTPKGYIEVTLSDNAKTDDGKDAFKVSVRDTGIGISKEDQKKLFKKFSRVANYIGGDEGDVVRPGGTGLGLYVAKAVVDGHDGKIWVDSEIGKGSDFQFVIPKHHEGNGFGLGRRKNGKAVENKKEFVDNSGNKNQQNKSKPAKLIKTSPPGKDSPADL